jgi:MtN3 and saliva related transmembrane protein
MLFGTLGGAILTVAALPQILKIWRTWRSDDVSLAFVVLIMVGRACWLAHGIATGDAALFYWNIVGVALAAALTVIIVITRRHGGGVITPRFSIPQPQQQASHHPSLAI